jgi:hypothetical protein
MSELSPPALPNDSRDAFRPLAGSAKAVVVCLALAMAADSLSSLSNWSAVRLIQEGMSTGSISPEDADAMDSQLGIIGLLQFATMVPAAIAFIAWLRKAYRNLAALSSRRPSYTLGWTIGAWFVPFLNLVRPFQIIREIEWFSSSPSETEAASPMFVPRASSLLGWWWGTWTTCNVLSQVAFRLELRTESAAAFLGSAYVSMIGDLVGIVAGILAIQLVLAITRAQETAAARPGATIPSSP